MPGRGIGSKHGGSYKPRSVSVPKAGMSGRQRNGSPYDDLAEGLFNDYKANARQSLDIAEQRVRLHLRPFFGHRKAHEITPADVRAYIAHQQGEDASNGTINRELAALKRAFNLAVQAEKIIRKPYIPMLTENNARQGFFERADFERLLASLPDYWRPPVTFAYHTGWRLRSEVLPLRWDQVDLEQGTVRLDPSTTKNKDGRLLYPNERVEGPPVGTLAGTASLRGFLPLDLSLQRGTAHADQTYLADSEQEGWPCREDPPTTSGEPQSGTW